MRRKVNESKEVERSKVNQVSRNKRRRVSNGEVRSESQCLLKENDNTSVCLMKEIEDRSDECSLFSLSNEYVFAAISNYLSDGDLLTLRMVSKDVKSKAEEVIRRRNSLIVVPRGANNEKLNFLSELYSSAKSVQIGFGCDLCHMNYDCKHTFVDLKKSLSILKAKLDQIENLIIEYDFNDQQLLLLSQIFSKLKSLDLSIDKIKFSDGLSQMLLNLSSLEALILTREYYPLTLGKPIQAICSHQYLTHLDFIEVFIDQKYFKSLIEARGAYLEFLAMAFTHGNIFKQFYRDVSFYLQEIFNNCIKIRSLQFNFRYSTIENVKLVNIPSLTNFFFRVKNFTLNTCSERLAGIERLHVFPTESSDEQCARLISSCPAVKSLSFKTRSEELFLTFQAISKLKFLEKLETRFNEDIGLMRNSKCVDFNLRVASDSEFTQLIEIFERMANERSNKIINLKVRETPRAVPNPLPPNLKLIFLLKEFAQ